MGFDVKYSCILGMLGKGIFLLLLAVALVQQVTTLRTKMVAIKEQQHGQELFLVSTSWGSV